MPEPHWKKTSGPYSKYNTDSMLRQRRDGYGGASHAWARSRAVRCVLGELHPGGTWHGIPTLIATGAPGRNAARLVQHREKVPRPKTNNFC
jgi:hypothetical protein